MYFCCCDTGLLFIFSPSFSPYLSVQRALNLGLFGVYSYIVSIFHCYLHNSFHEVPLTLSSADQYLWVFSVASPPNTYTSIFRDFKTILNASIQLCSVQEIKNIIYSKLWTKHIYSHKRVGLNFCTYENSRGIDHLTLYSFLLSKFCLF